MNFYIEKRCRIDFQCFQDHSWVIAEQFPCNILPPEPQINRFSIKVECHRKTKTLDAWRPKGNSKCDWHDDPGKASFEKTTCFSMEWCGQSGINWWQCRNRVWLNISIIVEDIIVDKDTMKTLSGWVGVGLKNELRGGHKTTAATRQLGADHSMLGRWFSVV